MYSHSIYDPGHGELDARGVGNTLDLQAPTTVETGQTEAKGGLRE